MVNAELRCQSNRPYHATRSSSVNHFPLGFAKICLNALCTAEVKKGCLMGVSSRATRPIEPKNGDLLMPDLGRKPRLSRMHDVEDALFEPVNSPRDVFSRRFRVGENTGAFKSRLSQMPEHGPFPADFAQSQRMAPEVASPEGRLGVFGTSAAAFAFTRPRLSVSASLFALTVCAMAAGIFWMAGGHVLVGEPEARIEASIPSPQVKPALPSASPVAAIPDPVVTSSIPAKEREQPAASFSAPQPRPARIERAGSILMIRPNSN